MQTTEANRRFHIAWKDAERSPVRWPHFARAFEQVETPLLTELWIWYRAFEDFVATAITVLGIVVDAPVRAWLVDARRDATLEGLQQLLVEGYFNTVVHELAASPTIGRLMQEGTLHSATRNSGGRPSMAQHKGAVMLLQAASGGTVRYHTPTNHPWSHAPALVDAVAVFQRTIGTVPKGSLVHPDCIETSIAW